jgi:hypothetical protein
MSDMKEKRIVGSVLIKMKLERSMAEKFFSSIARPDPNYIYEGG